MDLGSTGGADNATLSTTELDVFPAEVVPDSAIPDSTGRWLALVAHATTASNTRDAEVAGKAFVSLATGEVQPTGAYVLGSGGLSPLAVPAGAPA